MTPVPFMLDEATGEVRIVIPAASRGGEPRMVVLPAPTFGQFRQIATANDKRIEADLRARETLETSLQDAVDALAPDDDTPPPADASAEPGEPGEPGEDTPAEPVAEPAVDNVAQAVAAIRARDQWFVEQMGRNLEFWRHIAVDVLGVDDMPEADALPPFLGDTAVIVAVIDHWCSFPTKALGLRAPIPVPASPGPTTE